MAQSPGIAAVHHALDRFLEARESARKFHGRIIGREVDPDHCLADWLDLIRKGDRPALEKRYEASVEKTAMNEASGSSGGYVVPPDLDTALMEDLSTGSLFRKFGAYVHPMTTLQVEFPVPDFSTAQSAGVMPYLGGFQMTWLAMADQNNYPATGMKYRNVVLNAWELGGYIYASNSFLADARGVEAWLTRLFGAGAAWYQDLAFFQGKGVGQPMGVINSGGAVLVGRATPGQVNAADVQKMISQMLPSAYEDGLYWFCHPTVLTQFNNTNFPGWVANYRLELYGRPVIPTGKCADLGTQGDLILAAPSAYIIGDRLQVEIAFAPEEPTAWKANESAFRVKSRVDGQPVVAAPITLSDASSKVSPIVVLQ